MGIRYLKKHAALEGSVSVDDAEPFQRWIDEQPKPAVHLGKCEQVHAAVLQVLLARRPRLLAAPQERWLAQVLASLPG